MTQRHVHSTKFASTDTVTVPGDVPSHKNFIPLTVVQLLVPWWLYMHGGFVRGLEFLSVRTCFALREMAAHPRPHGCRGPVPLRELQRRTGAARKPLQRVLKQLRSVGILPDDPQDWTPFTDRAQLQNLPTAFGEWLAAFPRPDVPRRVYREILTERLAPKQTRPVTMAVWLACLVRFTDPWQRTVTPATGAVCVTGTGGLAPAWIAHRFGVQEGSIRRVFRMATQPGGWMERFTAPWFYLRRSGGKTQVTLRVAGKIQRVRGTENVRASDTKMSGHVSPQAPLLDLGDSPSGFKPHNSAGADLPWPAPPPLPLEEGGGDTEKEHVPERVNTLESPSPSGIKRDQASASPLSAHITPADLRDPHWVDHWYHTACTQGRVSRCPANRLNVQVAAVHALQWPCDNPSGLFVDTIRQQRWKVFTQAEEDEGRRRLRQVIEGSSPARADTPLPAWLDSTHPVANDVLRVVRGDQRGSGGSSPPGRQEPHDQAHEETDALATPQRGRDSLLPPGSPGPAGQEPHDQAAGQRDSPEACTQGHHTWLSWGERTRSCSACEAHHQDCRCWGCVEGDP